MLRNITYVLPYPCAQMIIFAATIVEEPFKNKYYKKKKQ